MVHTTTTSEGELQREKDVGGSTAGSNPQAHGRTAGVVPTRLQLPTGHESPDENLFCDVVSDTRPLVHEEPAESGEGIEMTSISSPLYEPSDDESTGNGVEVTVI